MAHYKENGVHCFSPDDAETEFYIKEDATLSEIIEKAKEKFGENVDFEDITITAEHIHTVAIGYNRYDAFDYTNYLVVSIDT